MTAAKLDLTADDMARSPTAPPAGQTTLHRRCPRDLPPIVGDLAQQVTAGRRQPLRAGGRAAELVPRGRRLPLHPGPGASGNGTAPWSRSSPRATAAAPATASSSRPRWRSWPATLGIPARVAVGFLSPDRRRRTTWVYSAHDLHAWPELYFHGVGLGALRAHPGRAAAATSAPAYTTEPVPVANPTYQPSAQPATSSTETASRRNGHAAAQRGRRRTSSARRAPAFPWTAVGWRARAGRRSLGPGAWSRGPYAARAGRRLAGGAEDAWAELRDSAVDLGRALARRPLTAARRATTCALLRRPGRTGHRRCGRRAAAGWRRTPRTRSTGSCCTLEQVRYARDPRDAPGAAARRTWRPASRRWHGSMRSTLRRAPSGCRARCSAAAVGLAAPSGARPRAGGRGRRWRRPRRSDHVG